MAGANGTNETAETALEHVTAWQLTELQKAAAAVEATKRALGTAYEAYIEATGVYKHVWASARGAHDLGPHDTIDVESGAITRMASGR